MTARSNLDRLTLPQTLDCEFCPTHHELPEPRSPRPSPEIPGLYEIFIHAVVGADRDGVGVAVNELQPRDMAILIKKISAGGDNTLPAMRGRRKRFAVEGIIHPRAALGLDHVRHDRGVAV